MSTATDNKCVGDNVILEKLNFDAIVSDGRFTYYKWAVGTENIFKICQARYKSRISIGFQLKTRKEHIYIYMCVCVHPYLLINSSRAIFSLAV